MRVYSESKDVDHIRAKIFQHVEKRYRDEKRNSNLEDIACANKKRRGLLQEPPKNRTTP
jgi:hypothetical protein